MKVSKVKPRTYVKLENGDVLEWNGKYFIGSFLVNKSFQENVNNDSKSKNKEISWLRNKLIKIKVFHKISVS